MISTLRGFARGTGLAVFLALAAQAQQTPFHFDCATATGRHAGLAVPAGINPTISGVPLAPGDEIGVFGASSGVCGGAGVWTGFNLVITLWGDDPLTPELDGLEDAEGLSYRVWREGTDTEYSDVSVSYTQGNGFYEENGLYVLGELYVEATLATAPELIFPAEDDTVYTGTPLLQWTAIGGSFQPAYEVRVSEILESQAPEEALDGNTPLLELEDLFATSLLYPEDALELESGSSYAWQVRAVDDNGNAAAENEGYSAVGRFHYLDAGSGGEVLNEAALGGVIRDFHDDQLLDGAQILYTRLEMANGQLQEVPGSEQLRVSGGDGSFLFESVEDQSWFRLAVSHPGHEEQLLQGPQYYLEGDREGLLVLLQPLGGSLQGRIERPSGGAPVQGARVELSREGQVLRLQETGPNGVFAFENLPPSDAYSLQVSRSGWTSASREEITLAGGQGRDLGVFSIRPLRARIRATLLGPGNAPVVGAEVRVYAGQGLVLDPGAIGSGSLPEGTLLAGPLPTGSEGSCLVPDLPLNALDDPEDSHVVFVSAQGLYDSWSPARLVNDGETYEIELQSEAASALLYGTLSSSAGTAVNGAQVVLWQGDTPLATATTSPDGSWSLPNLEGGAGLRLDAVRIGLQRLVLAEELDLGPGDQLEFDGVMQAALAELGGSVSGPLGEALEGVQIQQVGGDGAQTQSDGNGSFSLLLPAGPAQLLLTKAGHVDLPVSLDLPVGPTEREFTLPLLGGELQLTVVRAGSGEALSGARVSLDGGAFQACNAQGVYARPALSAGLHELRVRGPQGADFLEVQTTLQLEAGSSLFTTVQLQAAARLSGIALSPGASGAQPLREVRVTVEGYPAFEAQTGNNGAWELRNLPTGVPLLVTGSRGGYQSAFAENIVLQPGENRGGVELLLAQQTLESLHGFNVAIESSLTLASGVTRYTGHLVDVPENDVIRLANPEVELGFAVEVGPDGNVLDEAVALMPVNAQVRVYNFRCRMDGITLRLDGESGVGKLDGEILVENIVAQQIPNSEWIQERISADTAPAIWADGEHRGEEDLVTQRGPGEVRIWGMAFANGDEFGTLNGDGLTYPSFEVSFSEVTVGVDSLTFGADEDGSLHIAALTISSDPPLTVNLGSFALTVSSGGIDEEGFFADGNVLLTSLENRQYDFEGLRFSTSGEFLGVTITPGNEEAEEIEIHSATVTLAEISLIQENGLFTFSFAGELEMEAFDDPIEIEELKYTENGDFSLVLCMNMDASFKGVLTITLTGIELSRTQEEGVYWAIEGNLHFEIPNLAIQTGDISIDSDGSVTMDEISIHFEAGAVTVDLHFAWSDEEFSGEGMLRVLPTFEVAAEFRYASSTSWYIRITAGVHIPLGPVTIVSVSGSLGREGESWIFGFGGGVTVANADRAIRLDVFVEVTTTNEGPLIHGTADVTVANSINAGHADILWDSPNSTFTGTLDMVFEKGPVLVEAQVVIAVGPGFWFFGGTVEVNIADFIEGQGEAWIAHNYQGRNGIHASGGMGYEASGDLWSLDMGFQAQLDVDWSGNFSGSMDIWANGSFDLEVAGAAAEFAMGGTVSGNDSYFACSAYASVSLRGYWWSCDRDNDCWTYCFPTGGVVCISAGVNGSYDSRSGWDFSVDL